MCICLDLLLCTSPRVLSYIGERLDFPVLIAPMAMQRMAHPDGELATARAAAKLGIPMVRTSPAE